MSKEKEKRYIYVRDPDLTVTGFTAVEEAHKEVDRLTAQMGDRPTDEYRIRVRLRNRTNLWDVVVKTRREATTAKGD